jgi:pimeloyl-ACP methyl ester carboxylesterase
VTGQTYTEDRYVAAPGGKMFVRMGKTGEQREAPIILLHDSLGCVELWGAFPAALAERTGRTVIAYDRLGFGRSDPRENLPSLNFIREEAEVYFPYIRSGLGISDFCLLGHSVGGGMAVAIAACFADECRAVITESAQAFVEERTIAGINTAKQSFENAGAMRKLEMLHGSKAGWVLKAWTDLWVSPEFAGWDLRQDLVKVECPLLAIHGDRDEYGSIAFPRMITELSGGEAKMMILEDCRHVPHREKPQVVLDVIAPFLEEIPARAGYDQ